MRTKPIEEFLKDINNDWVDILTEELQSKGYDTMGITDPVTLGSCYSSVKARRVQTMPRKVILSSNLSVPDNVIKGFNLLCKKILNGEDINPHLSKQIVNLQSDDLLFYDWGIHHFHLGKDLDDTGKFVRRTGSLAFGIVRDSYIYIIAILEHGAWTDKSLLEIVDAEWPELISNSFIGCNGIEPNVNTDELKTLRTAHVNIGIQLSNGHCYMAIGGGYTSAGTSMNAMREVVKLSHKFRCLHDYLNQHIFQISDDCNEVVDVHLKRIDNELYVTIPAYSQQFKWMNFLPLPQ